MTWRGGKTKTIRALLREGVPVKTIASKAKTSVAYVYQVRWREGNNGYHTEWMRRKRRDAAYRKAERLHQRQRYHARHPDAAYYGVR